MTKKSYTASAVDFDGTKDYLVRDAGSSAMQKHMAKAQELATQLDIEPGVYNDEPFADVTEKGIEQLAQALADAEASGRWFKVDASGFLAPGFVDLSIEANRDMLRQIGEGDVRYRPARFLLGPHRRLSATTRRATSHCSSNYPSWQERCSIKGAGFFSSTPTQRHLQTLIPQCRTRSAPLWLPALPSVEVMKADAR